ncbi:VirK family protein [Ewingella sp. S1.OA.A_B6]
MPTTTLVTLIFSALAFPAFAGQSTHLVNLDEVKVALSNGADVSMNIDLTKCKPTVSTTTPGSVQGGVKLSSFRITSDGILSFSDSHTTVDSNGKPIWQFIRYQVKPDQTVAFSAFFFSLPSYTSVRPEVNYGCAVNQGVTFFANYR